MNNSRYYINENCSAFPCHDIGNDEFFNCMFCFCPLYTLGNKCEGNFKYLTDGTKDCSECLVPHTAGGYEKILSKIGELIELAKINR